MLQIIRTAAVVGAGYMGGGIAQSLADAGFQVVIADVSADAAVAARERLIAESEQFERQGLLTPGAAGRVRDNLSVGASIEQAVADVDFVEEAVPEEPAIKHDVLARISAACRPDTIIGSNTSTLPVATLAPAVVGPERFLTVHWSNPAPFVPGIEIVAGAATDPAIVPVVKDMLERAGRSGAQVADTPGFVLNRLQYVLLKEAMNIVEEGIAAPEDVDTIVSTTFGFRLAFFGPFQIADMAGLDVYANCFATFEKAFGERFALPGILARAVGEGRHGVKNGKGLTADYTEEQVLDLVAYRSEAYSRLVQLVRELGPSPIHREPVPLVGPTS
ncbi:3-hydroxyacyl-CoA dehydrogenase family protein [Microbacterium sp. 18062]|uniref:3-hydroxyacyl-CoA dehydrogenase family protein n=1 Tax=Microbacterium sp. 18062 TaxID=2681410 RepID=UPI0013583701|nr:3-hydroxyacyl-CoA dehydrogenase family protein [Microbacterium sp. 18062]